MTSFADLNLCEPLSRALKDMGHDTPTPIQTQAIPPALKGRDVMGIAQTGTGKTAGFSLPTLHHIFTNDIEPPKRGARVLILAPTRELASQIAESVRSYGRHLDFLSVACVFGGVSISQQIKKLSGGNDVIVATPGRLIDLLDRKAIRIDEVEVLILDEADQMMDMGFIHALRKIVPLVPKNRQTLFFSATLAPKIKQLSKQFLTDPVHVSVAPANTTAEKVTQRIYRMTMAEKQDRLAVELLREDVGRSLVFTRTKHGADRVVKRLAKVGIAAVAIHGNKSQGQRTRALEAFRSGTVQTMIATDVAARGIDIPDITHVFNFEIPNVPEQYVHRIGRTARANTSGVAIALVATDKGNDELKYLKDIEKLLKEKIPEGEAPEDLNELLRALKSRTPIIIDKKPYVETRKGRGKSKKKKGRFSKDKNARDGQGQSDARRSDKQSPNRPKGDRSKSDRPQNNTSKNDGPRANTENSGKPASSKPQPSRDGRSRKAPARTDSSPADKPKMSGSTKNNVARGRVKSNTSKKPQGSRAPVRSNDAGGNNPPRRRKKRPAGRVRSGPPKTSGS